MKKHRRQNYFERISRTIQNKREEALKRQIDSADCTLSNKSAQLGPQLSLGV